MQEHSIHIHTISILEQRKQILKNLINLHSNRFWHTLSKLTSLSFPQTLILGGNMQYIPNFLSLFWELVVPAIMATGKVGSTIIVIMSSILNVTVPIEVWNKTNYKRSEILRALQVYITVFWAVTLRILVKVINISEEPDVYILRVQYRGKRQFQHVSNHPQDFTTHKTKMYHQ